MNYGIIYETVELALAKQTTIEERNSKNANDFGRQEKLPRSFQRPENLKTEESHLPTHTVPLDLGRITQYIMAYGKVAQTRKIKSLELELPTSSGANRDGGIHD